MQESTVQFAWRTSKATDGFQNGVCLHGHTMYSEECLSFLPRYLHHVPGLSQILGRYEQGPRKVDFARAWWTPPLSPAAALRLERKQIASLGLRPFVSLTDHDNIEAGLSLAIASDPAETPISVEWTVPYSGSIFHLGVHNLPRASAAGWMTAMAAHTATPQETKLPELLDGLAADPRVLIVLNHPFWLEEGVTEEVHRRALDRILSACLEWFGAFEMNGTRLWKENAGTMELARAHGRPLISGGDRHAGEPAACINLTNARTFSEFAAEVRDGRSSVLFLPHYRDPMAMRLLEAIRDILRTYPEFPGRELWTDRVFYRGWDNVARSLSDTWRRKTPPMLTAANALIQSVAGRGFRPALRLLLAERGESL